MTIEVGQNAPEFTLPGKPGQDPVGLADYRERKNVVLLFFPLAWTSVCTSEMCSMRDDYHRYTDLGAEILGISVDSPFTLQAWSKEENFPFPLLSDFNREASAAYGALYQDLSGLKGVSKRAAFVIDKSGDVRYAEVCPTPADLPSFEAIQSILAELG